MYYESFDYDKNGNKVYVDKNGEVTRYKYDGMNRLTRAWNDNTYTEYEFDNFNNMSKEYELYGNSIETRSYYYDNANHLLLQDGKETVQYEYDNAGNLVKKITGIGSNAETAYYSYDGYNRLSGYADSDTVSEYTYNLDGLRESKTVNNIKTRYVYDGANIIGEITEETTYTYTRGTELIGYTSNSGDRLYYVQDGHGNVTALLNEDGTERKTYNYNPYGKEEESIIYPMGSKTAIMLWRLQVETPHNPFRYCGEYYDDETDLIYLRNRYYDNQTGRFITEDPIKSSANWYIYCNGNPVNNIDPWGLSGIKKDGTYYITHRLDGRLLDLKKEYLSATTDEQRAKIAREAQKIRNSGKKDVDWSVSADKTLEYYMIDTDVTQKLNDVISSSESENWWKRFGEFTTITNAVRYLDFARMVMPGGKYDLKSKPEWQGKEHFIYNGEIIWYDDPGNILYGHLGKVMGFDDNVLKTAGGAVQIAQGRTKWEYVASYFDDPRDQKAIQKGIDLFKKTHNRIWW